MDSQMRGMRAMRSIFHRLVLQEVLVLALGIPHIHVHTHARTHIL